jgi:hypothetical protein
MNFPSFSRNPKKAFPHRPLKEVSKITDMPFFTENTLNNLEALQCSPRALRPAGESKIRRARRRDGPRKWLGRTEGSPLTDYWRWLDRRRPRRTPAMEPLWSTRCDPNCTATARPEDERATVETLVETRDGVRGWGNCGFGRRSI